MTRYLRDSGVLSDYVYRRGDVVTRLKAAVVRGIQVGTATPVVAELFAGAELSQSRERILDRLGHALAPMVARPFDRPGAGAAETHARLKMFIAFPYPHGTHYLRP